MMKKKERGFYEANNQSGRDDCDAVTSGNPRVLADIYKEDLRDDFLVADKKWRDLFHIWKQRGWKWKYGSGIVEKNIWRLGSQENWCIIGTNILLSPPRSVVEFIRNKSRYPWRIKRGAITLREIAIPLHKPLK